MSELMKYGLYFVLGGLMVTVSAYVGSRGQGFVAALASTLPVITGATFVLIYLNGGTEYTLSYAKHLTWFALPWLAYVGFMILTMNRLGFWFALMGGLVAYSIGVVLLKLAIR